jgi:serine/threonine-protein phosphatase 2A regulatory subunit B''
MSIEDDLIKRFKNYLNSKNYKKDDKKIEQEEIEEFHRIYPKAKEEPMKYEFSKIPKFFTQLPKEDDLIQQRLREEARAIFLQKKNKELLSNEELDTLKNLLEENYTEPAGDDIMIDYKNFRKVGSLVGEKCQ